MTHWTEELYEDDAALFATVLEHRFDQAPDEVQQLLTLIEQEHGGQPDQVLDVACGVGRHALAFAEAGCTVDGLDISGEFIEQARARAIEQGLADRVDFHVADMRELDEWDGTYDLITNFWNSIGYYDKQTDVEILEDMRRLLSADGTVAIEMSNKEQYVKNFESSSVSELDDHLHVSRTDVDLTTGRFHTTVDVFRANDGDYEYLDTMEFRPRLYAPVELKELCERAGYTEIALFGGFDGAALALDSPRVVVLAR